MKAGVQAETGAQRFGSRTTAVLVLLGLPALYAGQYLHQPQLQHLYQPVLDFMPIWAPACTLFWTAALLRLFWPDRLPNPLPRDSDHMRFVMRLGSALYWGAAAALAGAIVSAGTSTRPLSFFGLAACLCLGLGMAIEQYARFRRAPGTCAVAGPETTFLLPVIPVLLVFVAMAVVVTWGDPGWTLGTGGLFLLLLFVLLRMLKQDRARRREERDFRAAPGIG